MKTRAMFSITAWFPGIISFSTSTHLPKVLLEWFLISLLTHTWFRVASSSALYYKFTSDDVFASGERCEGEMENVGNRSKRSVTTRNWMMYLFIFLLLLPLRMRTASLVRRFQERAAENEQIIIMVQHPASLYALMPRRKESSLYMRQEREKSMHTTHRVALTKVNVCKKRRRETRSIIIVTAQRSRWQSR